VNGICLLWTTLQLASPYFMLHQDYAGNEKSRLTVRGTFEYYIRGTVARLLVVPYTQLGIKKRLRQSVFGQDSTFDRPID
jgi:hypothetical protein